MFFGSLCLEERTQCKIGPFVFTRYMFAHIFLTKKGQNEAKLYDFVAHKMCFFLLKERTSNSGPLGCASCIFELTFGCGSVGLSERKRWAFFFIFYISNGSAPPPILFDQFLTRFQ